MPPQVDQALNLTEILVEPKSSFERFPPIKDLVAASNKAAETFDTVADLIATEFRSRVEHPEILSSDTILALHRGRHAARR